MKIYDVAIIGAGPAGSVIANILSNNGLSVLLIEKGRGKDRRNLAYGWFGHALTSMGRITMLEDKFKAPNSFRKASALCRKANDGKVEIKQSKKVTVNNVHFLKSKYYRLKFSSSQRIAQNLFLDSKADIHFETFVNKISLSVNGFAIKTNFGKFFAKKCVMATGARSLEWIFNNSKTLGVAIQKPTARFGVRVELPYNSVKKIVSKHNDLKMMLGDVLIDDFRQNAFIDEWNDFNLLTALSCQVYGKKSSKINFMASVKEDFNESVRIARIINVLSGDKVRRERISEAFSGQISKHFSQYKNIIQKLMGLSNVFTKFTKNALIYSPDVRLGGNLIVNDRMETSCSGLYGAGHCTNKVVTTIGALASGFEVANSILEKE